MHAHFTVHRVSIANELANPRDSGRNTTYSTDPIHLPKPVNKSDVVHGARPHIIW
jgi:hypothetical protein